MHFQFSAALVEFWRSSSTGHCEELPKQRRGNPFPWQTPLDFLAHLWSCWEPKPPLCKGRWRGAPEGLLQCSWKCCAKSDCSMSQNPAAPSRKPLTKSDRWGTIPQSAKLTAPFTQRGLWCGGIQRVRWKIETAVQEPLRQHS